MHVASHRASPYIYVLKHPTLGQGLYINFYLNEIQHYIMPISIMYPFG